MCKLISEFSTCYKIFPSIQFLKTQLSHIAGQEGYSLFVHSNNRIDVDFQRDKELTGEKGEKYLLKDLSTYSNGIFQVYQNIQSKITKIESNYVPPAQKIEYNKSLLTYNDFLALKKQELEELELVEQNRILQEQKEKQYRIQQAKIEAEQREIEEQERQQRELRQIEEQKRRAIEYENQREEWERKDRIAREKAEALEQRKMLMKIAGGGSVVVGVISLIYIYWATIVAFLTGLFWIIVIIVIISLIFDR